MGILDYREIRSPNPTHETDSSATIGKSDCPDDFELFAKEFFLRVKGWKIFRHVSYGQDIGLDLGVEEPTKDGGVRWLVSCKHKAHSNSHVGDKEENRNLIALISEWECDGFIPFYTTIPSNKVESIISGIEKFGKRVKRYIKDDIEHELLNSPEGTRLAARYFPRSMVNHYGAIIKTAEKYSAKDVVIENGVASLLGASQLVNCNDVEETEWVKNGLVELANIRATFELHEPYFMTALRQAISLAPQFFVLRKPVGEITKKSDAAPTWDSYALYLHDSFGFAQFIAAVWSFWDYQQATVAFGEVMAFRSQPIAGILLSPEEVEAIKASKDFKMSAAAGRASGLITPGQLGIRIQDRERDILVRLFAFAA